MIAARYVAAMVDANQSEIMECVADIPNLFDELSKYVLWTTAVLARALDQESTPVIRGDELEPEAIRALIHAYAPELFGAFYSAIEAGESV